MSKDEDNERQNSLKELQGDKNKGEEHSDVLDKKTNAMTFYNDFLNDYALSSKKVMVVELRQA